MFRLTLLLVLVFRPVHDTPMSSQGCKAYVGLPL